MCFKAKILFFILLLFFILYSFLLNSEDNNQIIEETNIKKENKEPTFLLYPQEINPGDFLVLFIDNIQPKDFVEFKTNIVANQPKFANYKNGKLALWGISYHATPNNFFVNISITRDKKIISKKLNISILPKDFPKQYLNLTKKQNAKRDFSLWEKDYEKIKKAKAVQTPSPLWNDAFILPLEGKITTDFGTKRYINKTYSGRHAGIDIASPQGSIIKASNSGIVVLAEELNVTGKTVIINHGLGLFSSYAHLDTINVQKGDSIKIGEEIGAVGSTGFSTGPHLHWTISLQNVFINPWLLLKEDPLSHLNSKFNLNSHNLNNR